MKQFEAVRGGIPPRYNNHKSLSGIETRDIALKHLPVDADSYNNHKSLSGIETIVADVPEGFQVPSYNNHKSLSGIETQSGNDDDDEYREVIITTNPFQGLKRELRIFWKSELMAVWL